MSKNQQYAEQYADFAMEQMRKYGIPASVTLAQGILESSNGQSRLALNENNHFGIKATPRWIAEGGKYGLYTDDKPNEKFCSYDSVGDSYEHHSRFLVENKRYDKCFALDPDDYKGWTEGLAKAGYASGSNYAKSLQKIIEVNGLQKYDRMVMAETKAQGLEIGQEKNADANKEAYSFPVEREDFMFVTSPFGMRTDPMDAGKQQMHKGIDIRCKGDAVLATENNGKVVAVNQNANTAGGKSVTIEYPRSDGSKVQNTYMHLSSVDVKVGDTVQAGQKVGVSGEYRDTDYRRAPAFRGDISFSGWQKRDMDPAVYLAEIAEKGNIKLQALHNENDLLAKYTHKRDLFCKGMDALGLVHNVPQGAYYVMMDISEFGYDSDLKFCEELAAKVGVGAVPGSSFFREPVNHLIRFHFAKKDETLNDALNHLETLRSKIPARAAR